MGTCDQLKEKFKSCQNQIIMQTQVKYQYQQSNQKAIKFVLPSNLQDKYRQYNPATKQLLKSTQKCPFTSIRQLIIAFKTTEKDSTDLQKSDILREKYHDNGRLENIDAELNRLIGRVEFSQIRSNKLIKCISQYNKLFHNCEKNVLQFTDQKTNLVSPFGAPLIEESFVNRSFLDKQSNYFQFLTYSHEFERALVLASVSHPQLFKSKPNSSVNIDNFRLLLDYSKDIQQKIERSSNILQQTLFQWRTDVKEGTENPERAQKQMEEFRLEQSKIDGMISTIQKFSVWFQKDREQVRRVYESDSKRYRQFLHQYTFAKEKFEMTSKQSFLNQTIKDEKIKLDNHLKKNYGLIVPYNPSDDFVKIIMPIQNSSKRQFKDLLRGQLQPLQIALQYINNDYQMIYRDACDGRDPSGVRRRIEKNISIFNTYENQQNPYFFHLNQSCRKLMKIVR